MKWRFLPVLALLAATPSLAWAWGSAGHRVIGRVAIESLPPELPDFVRSPLAVDQIGELAREPDRAKQAGQPHDADLDSAHYIDGDDEGRVLGGPLLSAMPRDRADYETALRAVGSDTAKAGALYYSMVDGWQQLVKDFAYWRAERVGEKYAKDRKERAWFAADRKLREAILIHDLGYWAHFVGDGSQPLHASKHYNGWGDYPNPKGYTQERIHAPFEGAFVNANVTDDSVRKILPAPATCTPPVQACVSRYLLTTLGQVEPLYTLWGAGGFKDADPRGVAFANVRVAAGAAMLRDLVVAAWRASDGAVVGYPAIPLKTIESSRQAPFGNFYGQD